MLRQVTLLKHVSSRYFPFVHRDGSGPILRTTLTVSPSITWEELPTLAPRGCSVFILPYAPRRDRCASAPTIFGLFSIMDMTSNLMYMWVPAAIANEDFWT
jgi:hypothetical protein